MKYRCGGRNNKDGSAGLGSRSSAVENGRAGLEAETNSIKWQCRWKQKGRDGMQCRCGSRNSRDSIAGVEA